MSWLSNINRRQVVTVIDRGITASFVLVAILVLVAPLVVQGPGSVPPQLPDENVTDCVQSPERPVDANASIRGSIQRTPYNTVTITYRSTRSDRRTEIGFFELPEEAEIINAIGFRVTKNNITRLNWVENAAIHSVRYRMNDSDLRSYPSTDAWLLTATPDHGTTSVYLTPESRGYVGSELAFLGPYKTVNTTVGCQTITAILPQATLPGRTLVIRDRLQELTQAASALQLGHHHSHVRAFVVTTPLENDRDGFNPSLENEFVVSTETDQPPSTIWIHEYVHTMQDFATDQSAKWTIEATAEYLSYRVALEHGYISPWKYDAFLAGSRTGSWDTNLSEADHPHPVSYRRGGALLAHAEQQLHEAGNGSIVEATRQWNQQGSVGNSYITRYLQRNGVNKSARENTYFLIYNGEQFELRYSFFPEYGYHETRNELGDNLKFIRLIFLLVLAGETYKWGLRNIRS